MGNTEQYLQKRVIITNKRGARYAGVFAGIRHKQGKFCLTNLAIINRVGAYTVSGTNEKRWFNIADYSIELEQSNEGN